MAAWSCRGLSGGEVVQQGGAALHRALVTSILIVFQRAPLPPHVDTRIAVKPCLSGTCTSVRCVFEVAGQIAEDVSANCVVNVSEAGDLRLSGLWNVANEQFRGHTVHSWARVDDDTIRLQLLPPDSEGTEEGAAPGADGGGGRAPGSAKRGQLPGLPEPQVRRRRHQLGARGRMAEAGALRGGSPPPRTAHPPTSPTRALPIGKGAAPGRPSDAT